jgi:uroporphyrinogen decarboxylase
MSDKPILRVLRGEALPRPPVWLMRQAGRYLPEYREVRTRAGSFLNLCYNPELAAEVTLQPVRRFGFDAAILFADILLVPHALGLKLTMEEGEGPRLDPVRSRNEFQALRPANDVHSVLSPVYETIARVRAALPPGVALIGFAGAPFTVASYMVAGRGTPGQEPALAMMDRDPALFSGILDRIAAATAEYLIAQARAGAEVLMLFDSWAGAVPPDRTEAICVKPVAAIIAALHRACPEVPVIAFPRGIRHDLPGFARATGAAALGLGQDADLAAALTNLEGLAATQGNLDPEVLLAGGAALDRATEAILEAVSGRPHIFNLGHGILPATDPLQVAQLLRRIRG